MVLKIFLFTPYSKADMVPVSLLYNGYYCADWCSISALDLYFLGMKFESGPCYHPPTPFFCCCCFVISHLFHWCFVRHIYRLMTCDGGLCQMKLADRVELGIFSLCSRYHHCSFLNQW
jgi:hypothetical protein